jgi:hypothetical protein
MGDDCLSLRRENNLSGNRDVVQGVRIGQKPPYLTLYCITFDILYCSPEYLTWLAILYGVRFSHYATFIM